MAIRDTFGRTFKTLRLSLINTCNLGCIYCVSSEDKKSNTNDLQKILSYTEIAFAVKKLHALLHLETIRLTGGEPTLYKDLIPIISEIKKIGIKSIKMTSNGYLLKNQLPELYRAGLTEINISLDAISNESFNKISGRKNIERILEAIDEALRVGIKIKINAVILRGVNDDQIIPLLKFSEERNITLRFLELMRMGPLHQTKEFDNYFISEQELLKTIETHYNFTPLLRKKSATANYWITDKGYTFGIIANESAPFCIDCNRLRLDSYGNVYGCLSNDKAISIADVLNDENILSAKLHQALAQKQSLKFTGSSISMMSIGG